MAHKIFECNFVFEQLVFEQSLSINLSLQFLNCYFLGMVFKRFCQLFVCYFANLFLL